MTPPRQHQRQPHDLQPATDCAKRSGKRSITVIFIKSSRSKGAMRSRGAWVLEGPPPPPPPLGKGVSGWCSSSEWQSRYILLPLYQFLDLPQNPSLYTLQYSNYDNTMSRGIAVIYSKKCDGLCAVLVQHLVCSTSTTTSRESWGIEKEMPLSTN